MALAIPCAAQTYPSKPIRLVVPFAPGGSSSLVARAVAAEMEKGLGQSIVIENKGGGGGNLIRNVGGLNGALGGGAGLLATTP